MNEMGPYSLNEEVIPYETKNPSLSQSSMATASLYKEQNVAK